jgi:heptaprenylglyceryl phosphate synthase
VHLAVGGGVDQVEQVREALAQADAAAAAVADVEHALHLGLALPSS